MSLSHESRGKIIILYCDGKEGGGEGAGDERSNSSKKLNSLEPKPGRELNISTADRPHHHHSSSSQSSYSLLILFSLLKLEFSIVVRSTTGRLRPIGMVLRL